MSGQPATAKGRRVGRPVTVDQAKLDYAAHLRTAGRTIAEIVAAQTGIPGPACIGICRPGPRSRSQPASFPPQSPGTPGRVPHRPPLRESSPDQAYGTPLGADTA